jgi:hypothetical protein
MPSIAPGPHTIAASPVEEVDNPIVDREVPPDDETES